MKFELTTRDIQQGFWYYRPDEGFPPTLIEEPEEYDRGSKANIACTQTNRPRRDEARLVSRWCDALPSFSKLEFLWFNSRVPQELFDAACRVPNLKGLYIKSASASSIDSIADMRDLLFLHIGNASRLMSIAPLARLKNLIWLELENIKCLRELTVIGELDQLLGLQICGSMWTTQVVNSLSPLSRLTKLRHLSLPNLRATDKTLSPLFSLSSLEYFHAARWWNDAEVSQLRRGSPHLADGRL